MLYIYLNGMARQHFSLKGERSFPTLLFIA
jgi:hypothetical protein